MSTKNTLLAEKLEIYGIQINRSYDFHPNSICINCLHVCQSITLYCNMEFIHLYKLNIV